MTRQRIPDDVLTAAHARARAREARDWPEADRLRAEIEAAGWNVVDRGTDFALTPAAPPDLDEGVRVRYGSSATVPSRLDEPATGLATIVIVATDWPDDVDRARGRPARRIPGGDQRGRRRRRTVRRPGGGAGGPRGGRRGRVGRPAHRGRLDQRAPGARRGDERGPASGERADRHPPRHERRADGRRRDAARRGSSTIPRSPSRAGGGSARPTCATSRTRRPATSTRSRATCRRSGGPTTPSAARSTSGSASTATSTSGGASSCATRGRGPRRAAAVRLEACPPPATSTAAARACPRRSGTG